MTELVIAGGIDNAQTHLALVGLASIIEDMSDDRPRLAWTRDWPSTPILTSTLDHDDIAQKVLDHAEAHRQASSWVAARMPDGPRKGHGVFTVRAAQVKEPRHWQGLADRRRAALGLAGGTGRSLTTLDHRMLVALGEPAYWWREDKIRNPDYGASRWEMKTRNRGEEFIRDRLSALAAAVAARTPMEVLDGLTGASNQDEVGKNSLDSRTSTGLTTPRPTDNAVAWCALWGLSTAPTIHRLTDPTSAGMSQSPGIWPHHRVHPDLYALPVFTDATTSGRFAAILTSDMFGRQLRAIATSEPDEEPRAWLKEQGVRAVVTFPTRIVGSRMTRERQLLTGTVHPM